MNNLDKKIFIFVISFFIVVKVIISASYDSAEISPSADSTITGIKTFNESIVGSTLGMMKLSSLVYTSSSSVTLGDGSTWDCNGSHRSVTSDTVVSISSPTGEDFYYLYDDDSEASGTTPTLIFSTTEPSYSADKFGWYNGNDRCLGGFFVNSSNNLDVDIYAYNDIVWCYFKSGQITLESSANPDGNWNATSTADAQAYSPVLSDALYVRVQGADSGAQGLALARSNALDNSRVQTQGYDVFRVDGNIFTGTTNRSIDILGNDDDDNVLACYLHGYRNKL
jgi:hypothetical protein